MMVSHHILGTQFSDNTSEEMGLYNVVLAYGIPQQWQQY